MKFKIILLTLITSFSLNIYSGDLDDIEINHHGLRVDISLLDDAMRATTEAAIVAKKAIPNQNDIFKIIEIAELCPEIRHLKFDMQIFNVATEYYKQLAERNEKS